MNNLAERLKKEKDVIYISSIKYYGKEYVKTAKKLKSGIEYIYYEIENGSIKDVEDKTILLELKDICEISDGSILY